MNNTFESVIAPSYKLVPQEPLISGIPDGVLALIAPVVGYWVFSMFFHIIDTFQLCEYYRIHPSEEVASRNKASRMEVLREVIQQHVVQTIAGLIILHYDAPPTTGDEQYRMWVWRQHVPAVVPNFVIYYAYMYGLSIVKVALAFTFIDSWQYWLHRIMHQNKTLYRMFHSRHHRLYVPYAYGALYNMPVEGFLLDTLGSGLAAILTGLSHREQVFMYTFATLKTVDDHCGYALPFDPFQILFPNNAVYHDIHHQNFGIKTNFSQPFFTFWDTVSGTKYHALEKYQDESRKITIVKYKQFLKDRKNGKVETKKNL